MGDETFGQAERAIELAVPTPLGHLGGVEAVVFPQRRGAENSDAVKPHSGQGTQTPDGRSI